MFELIEDALVAFERVREWFMSQPPPFQVISAVVCLAVVWVIWIVLRVILVALRATFRGL